MLRTCCVGFRTARGELKFDISNRWDAMFDSVHQTPLGRGRTLDPPQEKSNVGADESSVAKISSWHIQIRIVHLWRVLLVVEHTSVEDRRRQQVTRLTTQTVKPDG